MPFPRISSNELAWLIESTARLNSARLELLKALQASLPRSDDEGDDSPTGTLKGALTNGRLLAGFTAALCRLKASRCQFWRDLLRKLFRKHDHQIS